jgi:hypothetical protein
VECTAEGEAAIECFAVEAGIAVGEPLIRASFKHQLDPINVKQT